MRLKNNKFLSGALLIAGGAFFAKFIGAIYRIFLTPIIGSKGLGVYQMIFPVYTLLLDFSGLAVPNALAKLISSNESEALPFSAKDYLNQSLKIFGLIGLISSICMFIFSGVIAKVQGNLTASLGYKTLSPAVFLVSVLSCFRGYFQGKLKMFPTAFSQIVEQIVKLVFGLLMGYIFMPNLSFAVASVTFAITISEFFALIYLYLTYLRTGERLRLFNKLEKDNSRFIKRKIILTTLPIVLMGIVLPFSQIIDSALTINILNKYSQNATGLYGLFSGVVMTVINLPVSVIYGIAVVCVPSVGKQNNENKKHEVIQKALLLTFIFALIGSLVCFIFSNLIIKILFPSLGFEENKIAVNLLKVACPIIIFMAISQTENSALIGLGQTKLANVSMIFGVIIKIFLEITLISKINVNIFGNAIASIACYFSISLLNLIMLMIIKVKDGIKRFNVKGKEA